MHLFNDKVLATLMKETLRRKKVNADSTHHVVSSLVQTSLRGVDSHGINLFPHYCLAVDAGRIKKNPRITVHGTGECTAVIDADHAFGHHAGAVAMDRAVEYSKKNGMGAISVRNSTHFGAAAYIALRAAENNCLGFAFTNADALVKAFGAKEAFFGTNPICFTAPMESEDPYCLDMATSLVSWNRIQNHLRGNRKIPSHWAFDSEGDAVTDPGLAKTLNPAGEYKGFGLGMMVEILCAVLAGGPLGKEILPMYSLPLDATKRRVSHFFVALNIEKFINGSVFRKRIQETADRIRTLPPIRRGESVMVAGDPEKKNFAVRSRNGIPVEPVILKKFLDISPSFREAIIS